jgi:hypothetical protein
MKTREMLLHLVSIEESIEKSKLYEQVSSEDYANCDKTISSLKNLKVGRDRLSIDSPTFNLNAEWIGNLVFRAMKRETDTVTVPK